MPVVVHGEHGTLQLKPYQARIQRLAWGRVDQLLSVSSRLAERMAAGTGFSLERVRVIRNGVDLSRFGTIDRDVARRELGLDETTLVVGTAGRLVPVKDQRMLVGAVAELTNRHRQVIALIAGEGPLLGDLQAQAAALGLGERVRFLGHRPDLERIFAAMDIFVLSSISEGLSNTILEAMASGLPVVATRVGGADELVVDGVTGLLVPPRSAEALADAIDQIASDPSGRKSMARSARRRAYDEFAIERMMQNYAALYESMGERINQRSDDGR